MGNYMPTTRSGYNMFDMASFMQKACRRGIEEMAGFAAAELYENYHTMMWNRIIVISCEDCCGAFTKEIVKLRQEEVLKSKDEGIMDNMYVSKAIQLLCRSRKSRDACYYSCNFILANEYNVIDSYEIDDSYLAQTKDIVESWKDGSLSFKAMIENDCTERYPASSTQMTLGIEKRIFPKWVHYAAILRRSLRRCDMEASGDAIANLRRDHRDVIWKILFHISNELGGRLNKEIIALKLADNSINGKRPFEKKDEIFMSKAVMLILYSYYGMEESLVSQTCIDPTSFIEWDDSKVKRIHHCVHNEEIPEWVFDCHTLKGKKAGKTDWQMNIDEQAALTPLQLSFFDDASWESLYEWLRDHNHCAPGEYEEEYEFRKGRSNNPVQKIH